MRDAHVRSHVSLVLFIGVMAALAVWVSCGGGSSSSTPMLSGTGPVTTTLSDPTTCAPPNGQFRNAYVTITKVTAHVNANASSSDSGWINLVDTTSNPQQIDLLSLASTTCLLNQLGSSSGLPPGNYQQIRVYLLDNSPPAGTAVPSTNHCGGSGGPFNCVVLATDGSTHALQLSSEAQTGIKIPPGQIAGGGINLQAGQPADINIDFDTCASIVQQGNGQFRLKPTLRAGEVSVNTTQNAIGGTVVDSSSKNPIANAIVYLEQPDPNNPNLDRVVRSGVTGAGGQFIFCPLPAGNYDVVAAAMVTSTAGLITTYNATVTLKVSVGANPITIPLVAEPTQVGTTTTTSSPATIGGLITATTSGNAGTTADIALSALQPVGGASQLLVTVPTFPGSTPTVTTTNPLPVSSSATACANGAGMGCVTYTLIVPASNPQVGTFNSSGTSYTAPAVLPAIYWVNAEAFVPMNASSNPGAPDCNPSSQPGTFTSGMGGNNLSLNPGGGGTQNFSFTGCQ